MSCSKALDKFYTSDEAARTFIDFINKHINIDEYEHIIEPSAGAGALLNHLPSKTIGVDLMPERDDIVQCDFFDFEYPQGKTITIGNPPFGNRSKLAIDFFNKAAKHSDAICFIIPVTWEKYSIHKQLAEGWALIANERLPEESFELDGKPYRVRCTMQVYVSREAQSLRLTSRPTGANEYFDFVKKEDCDFAIRQAYPKTVLKDDIDGQSHYFIKAKVPGVMEVFQSFEWQSDENRKMLGGASVPCLDKDTVLRFYLKYADKRKTEKEPGEHPDFIISSRYNANAEFVIRGVRPKVSDNIDIYKDISDNTRYYSVQPLVPGVREVFDRVEWSKHWQGVSMPTVSIPDCIEIYEQYK